MRSKSPVFCPSVIGLHFCSAPLCSVGLGLVGAFDLATRALSASLRPRPGRAERKRTDPDKPSLPGDASQGGAADACCTPSTLGFAGALELAARARSASLGRSTGQSRTKTNRTGQAKLTRRRFAGQDHRCLLHSTQRRTYSVHGMHRYALEKCCSSLLRSHRMPEKCRSSLPRSHRWLDMAARACPGAAECAKSAARACSGATECQKSVARVCPGPTAGSKSAARAHSHEVRSFLAL